MARISEQDLERLHSSIDELTTLNEIATAINMLMAVEDVTEVIIDSCLKRIGADQGAVFLLDDSDQDDPVLRTFVRRTSESSVSPPLHLNWSILGRMNKNHQILVMNEPGDDSRFAGIDFHSLGIRSLLASPLITKNGLLGSLVLFNKTGTSGFVAADKRFLGIVGTQTAGVIENARLFEKERQLTALEEEMRVAKSIQEGYLPQTACTSERYEVLGFNSPAMQVGGDYFDMFALNEHEVVISIGDVSGKGVPAALMASEAQAVIRTMLQHNPDTTLPALASSLNRLFVTLSRPEQFITAFVAIYNSSSNKLRYVNAGHIPPMVVSADGAVRTLKGGDLIVGVMENASYTLCESDFHPGDLLFVCTDGVTENFGPDDEEYGDDRLENYLVLRGESSLATTRDELLAELSAFRKGGPQSDDITFLMLRAK